MNTKWLEPPEKYQIVEAATYSVLGYLSFPTFLALLSIGLQDNHYAATWFEIAFHTVSFLLIGYIFREYLSGSLLNAQINKEQMISTVAISVGLMLGVVIFWFAGLLLTRGAYFFELATFGTLPFSGTDLFVLGTDLVLGNKVFGTLCVSLLTPITTACIYYAVGFVPAYNIRPWLGYLVMALVAAFPRICNAVSWGEPTVDLVLYVAQLPVHFIGCWAYKRVDSIWAPIVSIAIANFVASSLLIIVA